MHAVVIRLTNCVASLLSLRTYVRVSLLLCRLLNELGRLAVLVAMLVSMLMLPALPLLKIRAVVRLPF